MVEANRGRLNHEFMQSANFALARIGAPVFAIDLVMAYLDGEPQLTRVAMGVGAIVVVLTSMVLESRLNQIRDRSINQLGNEIQPSS